MTVEISFADLHLPAAGGGERLPISHLDQDHRSHIHGRLSIIIDGRAVPSLGYWGPDDVCIDTWAGELTNIVSSLSASENATYTFDEGEQGQPAFQFVRCGDDVSVSLVDAEFSGGEADPEWQNVKCRFEDLCSETERFLRDLYFELLRQAPKGARSWWALHIPSGKPTGLP